MMVLNSEHCADVNDNVTNIAESWLRTRTDSKKKPLRIALVGTPFPSPYRFSSTDCFTRKSLGRFTYF